MCWDFLICWAAVGKLLGEALVHSKLLARNRLTLLHSLVEMTPSHLHPLCLLLRILGIFRLPDMFLDRQHYGSIANGRDIRPSVPFRLPCKLIQFHIISERRLLCVNPED